MMPVTYLSLLKWRGKPATARQAGDVQVAIGRNTGNAGIYNTSFTFRLLLEQLRIPIKD
jgi:hypothetical protein